MKAVRAVLIVAAVLLILLDVRAVEFLLHGPDVLHVVPESDGLRVLPYRMTAGDYAAFIGLVVIHGVVAFGFIRTRRSH